jgi:beta-glucanase (GH16 family)
LIQSNLSTGCPADPALSTTLTTDFTKPLSKDWDLATGTTISHDNNGAHFIVKESTDAPTISLSKYIFFGKVSAVVRAAPGAGIISSVILQSDDLDEIDLEWVGNQDDSVQTNFFGKGNTTTYNRGNTTAVARPEEDWYEYTIDWTKESIKWYVNGTLIRTVNYDDNLALKGKNYPQTPMRVKIGNWVGCPSAQAASDPSTSGTCSWAGGPAVWSDAPFTMLVKSVTVQDYGCASQYQYGDKSGSYQSIKSVGTCSNPSTTSISTQDVKTTTSASSSSSTQHTTASDSTTTQATRSAPNHDKPTSSSATATPSSGSANSQYTPTFSATSTGSAVSTPPYSTGNSTASGAGSNTSYSSGAYTATGGTGTGSIPTTLASSTVNSVSTTSSSSGQTVSPTIQPGAAMSLRSPRVLDFDVLALCLGVGYLVL